MSAESLFSALGVALTGVGDEARVRCFANPEAHQHGDRDPSCAVNRASGAWYCHACGAKGGPYDAALALGRTPQGAMALLEEHGLVLGGGGVHSPRRPDAQVHKSAGTGCTLADYAVAKRLSVEHLKALGLADFIYLGAPALRIPYTDAAGQEAAVRFRTSLHKPDSGPDTRFRWRKGAKPCLYGLWGLDAARRAGRVLLVEGESDVHTLLHRGIPALGLPGAASWSDDRDAEALDGIGVVYALVEPDGGGQALVDKLGRSRIADRLRLVYMAPDTPDASALHLAGPGRFAERLDELLRGAVPYAERAAAEAEADRRRAWATCRELAESADVLGELAADVRRVGLVGEARAVKLLYLAVVSRLLERPVSVVVKGPSAGGKSYLVETILSFVEPAAFYALSAMSERALAYSTEPLDHRVLVIYEAAGMEADFATYLVRSLLSEGRVRYETVEKTAEGLQAKLIEREGPTGLITTTTRVALHPENETRMLSLPVSDSAEQTAAVMLALAANGSGPTVDRGRWHALDAWLAGAEQRVTVPFAAELAAAIPPVAVRLRRDFAAILTLIRAHALLHQASRERDAAGRVLATTADYGAVRELVEDLVAAGVEQSVPASTRETVEQVAELLRDAERGHASVRQVADALGIDRSAAARRVQSALRPGYLVDLRGEGSGTRPLRLALGAELPEDAPLLPSVEHLCTCAEGLGGMDNPPPPHADDLARWERLAGGDS